LVRRRPIKDSVDFEALNNRGLAGASTSTPSPRSSFAGARSARGGGRSGLTGRGLDSAPGMLGEASMGAAEAAGGELA
jgi:hypothetical protein